MTKTTGNNNKKSEKSKRPPLRKHLLPTESNGMQPSKTPSPTHKKDSKTKKEQHGGNLGSETDSPKHKTTGGAAVEQSVVKTASTVDNPYLLEIIDLMKTIPEWDEFFSRDEDSSMKRISNWIRLEVLGQPLIDKYSWAIPNQRALRIISHFSPIIEVGAGKGYWASLLRQMGVDIAAFDRHCYNNPAKPGRKTPKLWTTVNKGDARMLSKECYRNHTLLLCYPDEDCSMSMDCMERYDGEYIIHIGELITTGTFSGYPQAPFGRTTCSQFQINLLEHFHCILVAELPRFPFCHDCITVWKRTYWVPGRSAMDRRHLLSSNDGSENSSNEDNGENGGGEGHGHDEENDEDEDEGDEEVEIADDDDYEEEEGGELEDSWGDVPRIERLPQDRAAVELAFLMEEDEEEYEEDNKKGAEKVVQNQLHRRKQSTLFK